MSLGFFFYSIMMVIAIGVLILSNLQQENVG